MSNFFFLILPQISSRELWGHTVTLLHVHLKAKPNADLLFISNIRTLISDGVRSMPHMGMRILNALQGICLSIHTHKQKKKLNIPPLERGKRG